MRILIAYASQHGSTKEVAERMRDRLALRGIESDCLPVDQVTDMSAYEYAIVGSAVHNVKWLPAASTFLKTHQAKLKEIPVWAFSMGYAIGMPRLVRGSYQESEDRDLMLAVKAVVPVRGHKLFNGRLLREHAGTMFNLVYRGTGGKFGDSIDWGDIEVWVDGIAEAINNGE